MDIYLKMVTNRGVMVKGGSKETDHVDWIEVLTFDQVHYGGSTASLSRPLPYHLAVPRQTCRSQRGQKHECTTRTLACQYSRRSF